MPGNMLGINNPRVRPHTVPNSRSSLGLHGPQVSSWSHPVLGAGMPDAGSSIQHWTPHGVFTPYNYPRMARLNGGYGMVARSPGAWFTPPALFQIIGIPDRALVLPSRPSGGRTGTPPVRHQAINPFPAFKPPLPTNPLPSSWPGNF